MPPIPKNTTTPTRRRARSPQCVSARRWTWRTSTTCVRARTRGSSSACPCTWIRRARTAVGASFSAPRTRTTPTAATPSTATKSPASPASTCGTWTTSRTHGRWCSTPPPRTKRTATRNLMTSPFRWCGRTAWVGRRRSRRVGRSRKSNSLPLTSRATSMRRARETGPGGLRIPRASALERRSLGRPLKSRRRMIVGGLGGSSRRSKRTATAIRVKVCEIGKYGFTNRKFI